MAGEDDEDEEDLFNLENLQDVLSPNPELMDFSSPNWEAMINDFSLDDDFTSFWGMIEPQSDDVRNDNVPEENSNGNETGNNVGETNTIIEVSIGENRMNLETGRPLTTPVPITPVVQKERQRRKTPLAIQRERTGNMTLKDLSPYFHLPMKEAARKMSVCETVVKKICRDGRLQRWPYRNIKSLDRKISALKSVLRTAKNSAVRRKAEEDIHKLEEAINAICNEILENAM